MNAVERLEFELAYYDVAVQDVSHYATEMPTQNIYHLIFYIETAN